MAAPMKMDSRICLVTLLLCFLTVQISGKQKPVTVTLDAKWKSTPLLLEASEYIAKENAESFWRFIEDVNKLQPEQISSATDQSYYHLILKYASKVLSSLDLNLFKLSLSLRLYSPAIEMYQQLALEENKGDCDSFVNIHGQRSCDSKQINKLIEEAKNRSIPPVFKFDRTYPGSESAAVVVILYAELGTAGFQKFHNELKVLASKSQIRYILRHYIQNPSQRKTRLSGYGVELNIKSTEYKAKDDTKVEGEEVKIDEIEEGEDDVQGFMFSTLKNLHPELKDDLKRFRSHLIDSSSELAPLKVWQLQDLSLQAAQRIVASPKEDMLKMLRDISQNFPSLTRSLVKTGIKDEFKAELKKNQQYFEQYHALSAGDSLLYLNGLQIDMDVYDIYTMLDVMKSEAKLIEGLYSLGFKGSETKQLLKLDIKESKEYAIDIRHTAVQFINDLENDQKYKNWPNSVQEMLRPTFPGMLRHVAKNFFNIVFLVDPLETNSRELLKMAEAFYVHSAPIRIAIVLVVNFDTKVTGHDDAGVALSRAYDCIRQEEEAPKALSFITDIYESARGKEITVQMVQSQFKKSYPDEDFDKVFGDSPDYDILRRGAAEYIDRSGLSDFPQVLLNGIPFKRESLNENGFEEAVVTGILDATPDIQKAIYHGKLHDFVNTLEWLMEQDHVLPRLNSRILSPPAKSLDFTTNIDGNIFNEPDTFKLLGSKDMSSIINENMKYISRKDELLQGVTMWIVCDLETVKGRELMYSAMKHLKHSHHMRMGIVFNPSLDSGSDYLITKAVYTAFQTLSNNLAKLFITKLVKEENVQELKAGTKTIEDLEVNGMDMGAYKKALEKQTTDFIKVHRAFVETALGWQKEARGVIANGKVLGPFDENEVFLQDDFDLLEKRIYQQGGKQIKEELVKLGIDGRKGSDLVMTISSLLTAGKGSSSERKQVSYSADQHSAIHIPADPSSPTYTVEAILDPLSQDAQKLSAILLALREVVNMDIKIFMNSRDKLSEMPLKLYYRYVLEPEITFKVDGSFSAGPYAKFTDLPQKSLLTLAMKPPDSWLVEAVKAPYDLDNILLEEVESGITAEFDLEYLLLEGHCSDSSSGQPPRGLQFTLGTNTTKAMVDTIVMANLGYFQLKANPGAWLLKLRDGRSKELYDITSHEYTDTPPGSDDVVVVINDFNSKIIRVKVAKKPDKMNEELLKDEDDDKSLWDSISSTISGDKKEEDPDKTLNIFSVASGHMYERLMRIMMLSVLKHTKSHVKFWFLKNYLSPSFKDFIPKMAKEYGFEYELVQYKWPRWLNQQQEKQRIMWGYKILFLDVLFPLDVKKFIFVDADQIVRTDLQELHDLDLGGAPYGYTPFCDSRKEMDGFRFWKSGYWASHLGNRKYHISALYVVDLKKFRRIAAGDRLRGQYQGLSQDPNSLSNLDQDLPNNMIHQVKIKSLPQDWLWCETWCNDQSKATAKTIDLCNNPQTKEPKLKAALRIAPEWKEYDYEIKVLWDKVYGTNTRSQIEYEPPQIDTEKIGSRLKDEL